MMKYLQILVVLILFNSMIAAGSESDSTVHQGTPQFIENQGSLINIIEMFQGRMIYLDFWATWCLPCIQQFSYEEQLQEVYEKYDIVPLFICVDNNANRDRWTQIVQENAVSGYHTFVPFDSMNAYKEGISMSEKYFVMLGYGYPHFLLIGREGQILVELAYRPEDYEDLVEQFEEYFD